MKKIIFSAVAAMMATMMWAGKPVIAVDYFSYNTKVGAAATEQIRSTVISELSKYGHIQIVDIAAQEALNAEDARRSSEKAMDDPTARVGEMKQLGANYLIEGFVSSITTTFHPAKENVSAYYSATFSYTIKLVNCADGTIVESVTYEHGGSIAETATGNSETDAFNDALHFIGPKIKVFVKKNFKMQATIIESDFTLDKKGVKMLECYITLGSEAGVTEKTRLMVSIPKVVLGTVTYSEVGELQVVEVVAPTISKCKVVKGGDVIAKAMNDYINIKATDPEHAQPITVESKEANASAEAAGAFFKSFVQ